MEVELAEGRFFAWVARNKVHAGGIKQFFLYREDPDLIAIAAANQGMVPATGTTEAPASESEALGDEPMSDQSVVGAHFQSDGMDVQPKKEKGCKTVR